MELDLLRLFKFPLSGCHPDLLSLHLLRDPPLSAKARMPTLQTYTNPFTRHTPPGVRYPPCLKGSIVKCRACGTLESESWGFES